MLEHASAQINNSEIMLCVVQWKHIPMCVIGIYKPPQASQTHFLTDLDKIMSPLMGTNLVFLGDFNLDCAKEPG